MKSRDELQQCVFRKQLRASAVCLYKAVMSFSSVFIQSSDELQQCVYAVY